MKKYDPDYKVKTREEAKKILEQTNYLPRTDHLKSLDYVYTENEKFLTPHELSELFNISISKLAQDRMKNVGVPFLKFSEGRRHSVRYPMSKIQEFINKHMKSNGEQL